MAYRMVQLPMPLNDLEGHFFCSNCYTSWNIARLY